MRTLALLAIAACGTPPPSSAPDASGGITCTSSVAGAYCGGDDVAGGDPSTLYQCPGADQPPTSAMACAAGCAVEPPGTPDQCNVAGTPTGFRLPWRPGVAMELTQDCNDSCCNDHVGNDAFAYDWANGGSFDVVAARGGTITHLKINSTTGCGTSDCVDDANILVIDHGDGTQSTYLHLAGDSLAPNLACGATVQRGDALATSGTTGWSTGIHLHFQVGNVHPGAPTCECGSDGRGCDPATVPWASFWPTASLQTVPIAFDEWPDAASCADRRITMPASQND